jgi:hypothetical protein
MGRASTACDEMGGDIFTATIQVTKNLSSTNFSSLFFLLLEV